MYNDCSICLDILILDHLTQLEAHSSQLIIGTVLLLSDKLLAHHQSKNKDNKTVEYFDKLDKLLNEGELKDKISII